MDKRKLLEIVKDVSSWRSDVFQLAIQIEQREKEHNAQMLREAGFSDAAELVEAG